MVVLSTAVLSISSHRVLVFRFCLFDLFLVLIIHLSIRLLLDLRQGLGKRFGVDLLTTHIVGVLLGLGDRHGNVRGLHITHLGGHGHVHLAHLVVGMLQHLLCLLLMLHLIGFFSLRFLLVLILIVENLLMGQKDQIVMRICCHVRLLMLRLLNLMLHLLRFLLNMHHLRVLNLSVMLLLMHLLLQLLGLRSVQLHVWLLLHLLLLLRDMQGHLLVLRLHCVMVAFILLGKDWCIVIDFGRLLLG
jgi:hypothetical protein